MGFNLTFKGLNTLLALVHYEGAWQIKAAQAQNDNASEGSAPRSNRPL
jgi:hypothetical protein